MNNRLSSIEGFRQSTFLFEIPLARNGFYIIHATTLEEIKHGNKDCNIKPCEACFNDLIERENLEIKPIDSTLSIIKKKKRVFLQ